MRRIKIFIKRHKRYSYLFSAFLGEPESAESQAELLEAAVEINEVNFIEDIIAPDSSVSTENTAIPGESVESLYAAFSDLDMQENGEDRDNRKVFSCAGL
jgi:hypothetical protein